MKKSLLLAVFVLKTVIPFSQNCLPDGITFIAQSQIDDFPKNYPGCKEIMGNVTVEGFAINNLNGLFQVTAIKGNLTIKNNSALKSLEGLVNLNYIGGNLYFYNNDALTNLSGFKNLTAIDGYLFIADNAKLNNPGALSKLNHVGGFLSIGSNNALTNLDHLTDNLKNIGGYLSIANNKVLSDLNGLANLTSVKGYLNLVNNDALNDFSGLSNLKEIDGYIKISGNDMLTSLNGLQNIDPSTIQSSDINEDLEIVNNPMLSECDISSVCSFLSFQGISANIQNNATGCNTVVEVEEACPSCPPGNLTFTDQKEIDNFSLNYPKCSKVPGSLTIDGITINNLIGLSGISEIQGNLTIRNTGALTSLKGLENLTSIGGAISIAGNNVLISLDGIKNINPSTISHIMVGVNPLLTECAVASLCEAWQLYKIELSVGGNGTGCNAGEWDCEFPDCPEGDVVLNTQKDIDDFKTIYPACTSITGNLTISGNDISDLSGIEHIRQVGGNLVISENTNLFDLRGCNVNSIGGNLNINNNPNLYTIASLEFLKTVGGKLQIYANEALTKLTGLQGLSKLEGNLYLNGNISLTSLIDLSNIRSINGNLDISGNNSLTSLAGLENLVSVAGYVAVYENDQLSSLSGIKNIDPYTIHSNDGHKDLIIYSNPQLSECEVEAVCHFLKLPGITTNVQNNAAGCNSVTEVNNACPLCPEGDLYFRDTKELDDFPLFYPNCTEIEGNVRFSGDDLTSLEGFLKVTTVNGDLRLDDFYSSSLKGLDNIKYVGGQLRIDNIVQKDINELNSLTSIGGSLLIIDNTNLGNIEGLSNLESLGGTLLISGNSAISNLNSLENLTSINGPIYIENNDVLTSLDGIQNIDPETVHATIDKAIEIVDNPLLSECAVETICQVLAVEGVRLLIYGNATGCNSKEEIEAGCANPGCPVGDLDFSTQQEIDDFVYFYQECTEIDGSVIISGNDITDLAGLSKIKSVSGTLFIDQNFNLKTLVGLEQLTHIGERLVIQNNKGLIDLNGLDNLNYVGGSVSINQNYELTDIKSLKNLTSVNWDLWVLNNPGLKSLEGLHNIVSVERNFVLNNSGKTDQLTRLNKIGGDLEIGAFQSGLTSLSILSNLDSIGGDLKISDVRELTNLNGLDDLKFIGGGVQLFFNPKLSDLNGLNFFNSINGDLELSNNHALTGLSGLENITSIGGILNITHNESLINLSGLDNLSSIGNTLFIDFNNSLVNLNGLNNLTSVGGRLHIWGNSALTNIEGIENINPTNLDPGFYDNAVYIIENPQLSECAVTSICHALAIDGLIAEIRDNGTGCNTRKEVEEACVNPDCPGGDLVFNSQKEIDDFGNNFPDCTEVAGGITIKGNDIINLNGLKNIVSVYGKFRIELNPMLVNVDGLSNLAYIGGGLYIQDNALLANLNGMSQLSKVDGILSIYNNSSLVNLNGPGKLKALEGTLVVAMNQSLTGLGGLPNLTHINGGLQIIGNNSLSDLTGLVNIKSIDGNLMILDNENLVSLDGLENLASIGGYIRINQNDMLTTLEGIRNIDPNTIQSKNTNEDLTISNNPVLSGCAVESICRLLVVEGVTTNIQNNAMGCNDREEIKVVCSGQECPEGNVIFSTQKEIDDFIILYPECTEINGNVLIQGEDITNVHGLANIASVSGFLKVNQNPKLTDLGGFQNLVSVGDRLAINFNDLLVNLKGLENITSIGGSLVISGNNVLSSLEGIQNIDPSGIHSNTVNEDLIITYNPSLSDCNVYSVCQFLAFSGVTTEVHGNAGGCNAVSEIETACGKTECPEGDLLFTTQQAIDNFFDKYPDCSEISGNLTIDGDEITSLDGLSGISTIGGNLKIKNNNILSDLNGLSNLTQINGFLRISNNDALTSLSGLDNLTLITGAVLIVSNNSLNSLYGIRNIDPSTIRSGNVNPDLTIKNNPLLSECAVASICRLLTMDAVTTDIRDNTGGCDNGWEIASACGTFSCPEGDLVFNTQQEIDDFGTLFPGCGEVPGSVTIRGDNITNLDGLGNLISIGKRLVITNNASLQNLNGLNNLAYIGGGMFIWDNASLVSLDGMSRLASIAGQLNIYNNASLTNINALQNMSFLGGQLAVDLNESLSDLNGLRNLTTINGNLKITENSSLTNIGGLENITSVGGYIRISQNLILESLEGIRNIDPYTVRTDATADLTINYNPSLSECAVEFICNILDIEGVTFNIHDNAEGCNTEEEITANCTGPECPENYQIFGSQQDIDDFLILYPECSKIDGNVLIQGDDITNLSGLSNIVSVAGFLKIVGNPKLSVLTGLANLESVGDRLAINYNDLLINLNGLEKLTSIGGSLVVVGNKLLTSLDGIQNIEPTGIRSNNINEDLIITFNPLLTECTIYTICRFLDNAGITFKIQNNAMGCNAVSEIRTACINPACPEGDLLFTTQKAIDDFLINYPECSKISGNLTIDGDSIKNLEGLSNIAYIGGNLRIRNNKMLVDLDDLFNLARINGFLRIFNNPVLNSLGGLNNVTLIDGSISVENNNSLTSLNGIQNINPESIKSNNAIADLSIKNNPLLSECAVTSVCMFFALNGVINDISNNGNGCDSGEQIKTVCTTGSPDLPFTNQIHIYPNPTNGQIYIEGIEKGYIKVIDIVGRILKEEKFTGKLISISDFPDGLYILQVISDNDLNYTEKIIKQ